MHKRLLILGTQGIPAEHGGFETLAEELALHLVKKGWRVTVYCQEEWGRTVPYETMLGRVRRVHIPVKQKGVLGSMAFGFKSAAHASRTPALALTLGYNNAFFSLLQRMRGKTNLFHMGDFAYKGQRYSAPVRNWLRLNERIACWLGHHLIVDNPETQRHFESSQKNLSFITNGALSITDARTGEIRSLGLESGHFSTVIALPTSDHSLLEIVQAFSQSPRQHKLVVLGQLDDDNPYHQRVLASASNEVQFVGPIYDKAIVRALRYHSALYFHGHQNGGTSPSLVESLAAGTPVVAFDTPANRWAVGQAGVFFNSQASCAAQIESLLADSSARTEMKKAARLQHAEHFTIETMLATYEDLLTDFIPEPTDDDPA